MSQKKPFIILEILLKYSLFSPLGILRDYCNALFPGLPLVVGHSESSSMSAVKAQKDSTHFTCPKVPSLVALQF